MNSSSTARIKSVLVAEDWIKDISETIQQLQARGLKVDCAQTKERAINLLAAHHYDALLLDLRLPNAVTGDPRGDPDLPDNGVEIVRRLASGSFEPEGTPRSALVFLVTAYPDDLEQFNDASALGIKNVFKKPAHAVEIAETLRIALEGR